MDSGTDYHRDDEGARQNPCLSCGACCTVFRASFYWAEGDDAMEGGVPVDLTVQVDALRRAMRNVGPQDRRCIALRGTPGKKVRCVIYERRPSVCRDFEPSWKAETPNPRCDRARAAFGLAPLHRASPASASAGPPAPPDDKPANAAAGPPALSIPH